MTALPDADPTRLTLGAQPDRRSGRGGAEGGARSEILTLTVEQRSEPISGSLELQGAAPLPFHGWLELLSLLERVRGAEPLLPPRP